MPKTIKLTSEIGEFETTTIHTDCFLAEMYINQGYKDAMEYFTYSHQFIPKEGKHISALIHLTLHIYKENQNVSTNVGSEQSIAEFNAKFDKEGDFLTFSLYDEDGGRLGLGSIHSDQLPEWLAEDGGEAYVTIKLEYDYDRTLEKTGLSSQEIEEYREWTQSEIAEWEANRS